MGKSKTTEAAETESPELYELARGVEIQMDPATGWSITKGEQKPLPERMTVHVQRMIQHGALIKVHAPSQPPSPPAGGDAQPPSPPAGDGEGQGGEDQPQ
jgi:hypothetical protein